MQRPQLAGLADLLNLSFPTCLDSVFLCLFGISAIEKEKKNPTICKNYKILHWQICSSTFTLSLLFVQEMDRRCQTVLWPYRVIFNTLAECSRTWHALWCPQLSRGCPPHPTPKLLKKKEKRKRKKEINNSNRQLNEANVISWSIIWILQAGKPQSGSTGPYQPVSIMGYISPGKIQWW